MSSVEDPRTPLLVEERVFKFPSVGKNFLSVPGGLPAALPPSPIYPTSTPLAIPLNSFGE